MTPSDFFMCCKLVGACTDVIETVGQDPNGAALFSIVSQLLEAVSYVLAHSEVNTSCVFLRERLGKAAVAVITDEYVVSHAPIRGVNDIVNLYRVFCEQHELCLPQPAKPVEMAKSSPSVVLYAPAAPKKSSPKPEFCTKHASRTPATPLGCLGKSSPSPALKRAAAKIRRLGEEEDDEPLTRLLNRMLVEQLDKEALAKATMKDVAEAEQRKREEEEEAKNAEEEQAVEEDKENVRVKEETYDSEEDELFIGTDGKPIVFPFGTNITYQKQH